MHKHRRCHALLTVVVVCRYRSTCCKYITLNVAYCRGLGKRNLQQGRQSNRPKERLKATRSHDRSKMKVHYRFGLGNPFGSVDRPTVNRQELGGADCQNKQACIGVSYTPEMARKNRTSSKCRRGSSANKHMKNSAPPRVAPELPNFPKTLRFPGKQLHGVYPCCSDCHPGKMRCTLNTSNCAFSAKGIKPIAPHACSFTWARPSQHDPCCSSSADDCHLRHPPPYPSASPKLRPSLRQQRHRLRTIPETLDA